MIKNSLFYFILATTLLTSTDAKEPSNGPACNPTCKNGERCNPNCKITQSVAYACPQYSWGQTGNIYHYYSSLLIKNENVELDCSLTEWGNFDGNSEVELGGYCDPVVNGPDNPVMCEQINPCCIKSVHDDGLERLPQSGYEPMIDKSVTILDQRFVDVSLPPNGKRIKVKLFLFAIRPREHDLPLPTIIVAKGFEVRDEPGLPTYCSVQCRESDGRALNLIHVRMGPTVYKVLTHDEIIPHKK